MDNASPEFRDTGFTIADWPAATIAARQRLDSMADSHYAAPLRAYDYEHNIIPPANYDRELLGAEVCAEFTIYHGKTPNDEHAFSAYIDSINVLEPATPRSPDTSLPMIRTRDLVDDD